MMDDFLKEIYIECFKQWILFQEIKGCRIQLSEDNAIDIYTRYTQSSIHFYDMNIIEISTTHLQTNQIEFYLHFQFKTIIHALELFHEMIETILKIIEKPSLKVLLSCTGGLTTGYFADRINEVVDLLGLDIEVSAVSYNYLYEVGQDYDIIMLAPQISYMYAKTCEILKNQIVVKIPPKIFAKYDVAEMIDLIQESQYSHKVKSIEHHKPLKMNHMPYSGKKILCLGLIRNSSRVHIAYRLYDEKNRVIENNEIIKSKLSLQDCYDVIDSMLVQYPDIEMIGFASPGIIYVGCVKCMSLEGLKELDLDRDFRNKYSQKFVFVNDVNSIAQGYYLLQDKYSTISFIFQPISTFAGSAHIVNDHLLMGRHHVSGEVQFLPLSYSDNVIKLHKTPEGALEAMAKTIATIIGTIDPELIVVACFLLTNKEELIKEVEKYVPLAYIPDIEIVDYLQEYMLVGTWTLTCQG